MAFSPFFPRFQRLALLAGLVALFAGLSVDRASGEVTTRVSVSSAGDEGDAGSSRASVSSDGRYVAFYSDAGNLVPGDTPTYDPNTCPDCTGVRDVFVRDRQTGTTVRVSVSSAGVAGNDKSDRPSISGDGRFVAFTSDADNLVGNDTNEARDIFVHDRDADEDGILDEPGAISTTRVSVSSTGVQANDRCNMPAISADGRHVAFRSRATNLVAGGTSGQEHIFVHDRQSGVTILLSVSSAGVEGNAASDRPAISSDGRYVAFYSDAYNLVAGDEPTYDPNACPTCTGFRDVFFRDRDPDENGSFDEGNGTTARVSVSSGGVAGNGPSSRPSLSADGRYVEFKSSADNLVAGDTNNADDVFVRDRLTNTTVRASVTTEGVEPEGFGPVSQRASVSHDGRYVAFVSDADDLVPNDTNLSKDIFVRDRQTGTTVRVSVNSTGVEGNASSNRASISDDGRFVAFYSDASNLVPGDEPTYDPSTCSECTGVRDIFVHDRDPDLNGVFDEGNGTTERVSVSSTGEAANVDCTRPSISADGRHVAFRSTADNLILTDFNGLQDIFVHDRQTGATVRVSVSSAGAETLDGNSDLPSISGDGRYVAFWSKASGLVPGDDPPYDPILCPSCTGMADIFVHDRDADSNGVFDEGNGTTTRVSVSSLGVAADAPSDRPWMAAGGRYVGFISEATNLVSGDTNNHTDVFVHDLQTSSTVRMSVNSAGVQGNYGSRRVTLSADGRFVALRSKADNLVVGDDPSFDQDLCPSCTGVRDVFLHDRDPDENGMFDEGNGVITRISVSTAGDPGDRDTGGPKLSGDGSVVAMIGTATNLVAGDTNHSDDVFARDLATSVTERLSVSSAGSQASTPITIVPDSDDGSISGDGRYVAFRSYGVNLVSRDTNLVADIFVHDRDVDEDGIFDEPGSIETRRVSISSAGAEADDASGGSKVSANGAVIAYYSDAQYLVPDDTNVSRDVFVRSTVPCSTDGECSDGAYCNGVETCTGGVCQAGTAIDCGDAVDCTVDSCNEATDSCDNIPNDAACDNGLFCDGAEICDLRLGCRPGTPVDCDDGLFCTGTEACCTNPSGCGDTPFDSCQPGTPVECPPGEFCSESTLGCSACPAPAVQVLGSRYLEVVTPPEGPPDYAIYVTGVDQDVSCVSGYVKRSLSNPDYGRLQGSAEYRSPGPVGWGTVHVYGGAVDDNGTPFEPEDDIHYKIIGGRTYEIRGDCDPGAPGTNLSDPVTVTMWRAGDTDNNNVVDIRDAVAGVNGFQGSFNVPPSCPDCYPDCPLCTSDADCWCYSPHQKCLTETGLCRLITIENVDITGDAHCEPNQVVSILDIVEVLSFFQGYPDSCNPQCP